LSGVSFVDVMVELRDLHAALSMEEIRAFLPFSREWIEGTLGVTEPEQLFLLEADRDLPPEIRERDLPLVDRSAGRRLPRGEGLYCVFDPDGTGRKAHSGWTQEGLGGYGTGHLRRAG
jgi:hypothetical protein